MRLLTIVPLLVLLALGDPVAADESVCSGPGDEALFSVDSWKGLREWFETYPQCDDGYLGEHATDIVMGLLTSKRSTLRQLDREQLVNTKFSSFVVSQINDLWSLDDLRVLRSVTGRCPPKLVNLCRDLADAASAVMENGGRPD